MLVLTIPSKYYEALGLSNEIDCIYANNMLILTPVTLVKEAPLIIFDHADEIFETF